MYDPNVRHPHPKYRQPFLQQTTGLYYINP